MSEIFDYLKMMMEFQQDSKRKEFKYNSIDDFILKHGRAYKVTADSFKCKRMKAKNCYANSFHLISDSAFTYVEGYAICIDSFPMLHAWCINDKDEVIDPTWKNGTEYFGVPFKTRQVFDIVFAKETYGIIDDWQNRFPILTGKIKYQEIKGVN